MTEKKRKPAAGEAPEAPETEAAPAAPSSPLPRKRPAAAEVFDYAEQEIPRWARDLLDVQLAIEAEDARRAGSLGFMARALVIATMPYKDPKTDVFSRVNGDFKLRILAGYDGGVPFGIYPRLLMSWVATEAVRTRSPVIELGDSLRAFLREVLDVRSSSGGTRGTSTRVTEQIKRLFGSMITAQYSGSQEQRGFVLRNVMVAETMRMDERDEKKMLDPGGESLEPGAIWVPQAKDVAGQWRSHVKLSESFFRECIEAPVPIDLRAYKALRASPMAMDIYTWLTYRMSYVTRKTRPIRWEALMMQFGTGLSMVDKPQAVRNFRKAFLSALKMVVVVYPEAKLEITEHGLVLSPSKTHVLPSKPGKRDGQSDLFV